MLEGKKNLQTPSRTRQHTRRWLLFCLCNREIAVVIADITVHGTPCSRFCSACVTSISCWPHQNIGINITWTYVALLFSLLSGRKTRRRHRHSWHCRSPRLLHRHPNRLDSGPTRLQGHCQRPVWAKTEYLLNRSARQWLSSDARVPIAEAWWPGLWKEMSRQHSACLKQYFVKKTDLHRPYRIRRSMTP